MRIGRLVLLLLLWTGFVGCRHQCPTLCNNICRTVRGEPKCFDYCDRTETFCTIATQHWAQTMQGQNHSPHFKDGYLDGFADYLHRGGTGNPPPMPPRRYWEPTLNGQRQNAIEEWRNGFRVGAENAIASGMREQLVIPSGGVPMADGFDMLGMQ